MPRFLRKIRKRVTRRYQDINPEDIFLDSANLPGFSEHRLEGRIEKPVGNNIFLFLRSAFLIIVLVLGVKLMTLQIVKGEKYSEISERNKLEHVTIFANRGVIYDRNHLELAYNSIKEDGEDYAHRVYADIHGLSHVLGYIKYPSKDKNGKYYDENYRPMAGVEKVYNDILQGSNGIRLTETDALGKVTSESVVNNPEDGKPLVLTIDARVNQALYDAIKETADTFGYAGGAGVIMDVETGEILALTSYPDYDSNVMTAGTDRATIQAYLTDNRKVFLDRAVSGLYTPGSIVKPIVALAALNEGVISPDKKILSTGSMTVPNPYDPSKPSIFKDWKAHGWTDMKEALAVSSDVYFYQVGGGYPGQKGIGIENLEKYYRLFGMTEPSGIELLGEKSGILPSPEWKAKNFDGDIWRVGDTYNTAIGQYGMQVTPLEAVRFTAAIANSGKLFTPTLVSKEPKYRTIDLNSKDWQIVREGMRLAVTGPNGTVHNLGIADVAVAGKTGTAQVGPANRFINSWVIGFFPYNKPRYAWTLLMERGPATNTVGAIYPMRKLLDWMALYSPQYFH